MSRQIPDDAILLRDPAGASAALVPRGAHLISWTPAGGGEALFVSRAPRVAPDAAIRGGVPIIFPQFGAAGPLPKHGFARTAPWEVVSPATPPDSAMDRVRLALRDSAATRALWPHPFRAELAVTLAEASLVLEFTVRNSGDRPFHFTAALHTYLRTADVGRTVVEGLRGVPYRDSRAGAAEPLRTDGTAELEIVGETDRLYVGVPGELRVHDRAAGRAFRVRADGFRDVVIWNPWAAGAAALPDMEAEEFREMLCVEAAQAAEPVMLEPGAEWRGSQTLELLAPGDVPVV